MTKKSKGVAFNSGSIAKRHGFSWVEIHNKQSEGKLNRMKKKRNGSGKKMPRKPDRSMPANWAIGSANGPSATHLRVLPKKSRAQKVREKDSGADDHTRPACRRMHKCAGCTHGRGCGNGRR